MVVCVVIHLKGKFKASAYGRRLNCFSVIKWIKVLTKLVTKLTPSSMNVVILKALIENVSEKPLLTFTAVFC